MSEQAASRHTLREFWADLPPAGRWLLSTVAVQTLGRGLTLPFTVIYLHEVRGISLDLAGLLMAFIAVVALAVTGPAGALTDRAGRPHHAAVVDVGAAGRLHDPGLRDHAVDGGTGLPLHRLQLRRLVAGVQRAGRGGRLRAGAPAVLRHQLRPGQPRHRAGRRDRRPLCRRRDPIDLHRDLPGQRGEHARADRPAARAAAARARPRRAARRCRRGRGLLPDDPAQAGRGLADPADLPRRVRRVRADGGRASPPSRARSAVSRPA